MTSPATDYPFADRILASHAPPADAPAPLITIGIPHYKQRRHLEVVLQSLFAQQFDAFEIVISDDCSPDDSNSTIPPLLAASGRAFRYYAQKKNLGYDGNVRFLLAAARGRYVFLLGNDDGLYEPQTLATVAKLLAELGMPQVAFTNVRDSSGGEMRRAHATRVLGSGPEAALATFRTFSFVGGLIYDTEWARRFETDRWDKSVFYQIYIAARIIAAGGKVAALDYVAVSKDVLVDGKTVPNAVTKLAQEKWSMRPRHSGMDNVIRVTVDAVLAEVPREQASWWIRRIVSQIYLITYPYWLLFQRRNGNWGAAAGLARGMWPPLYLNDFRGTLKWRDRVWLWVLWWSATVAGLTVPTSLVWGSAMRMARRIRRRQHELGGAPPSSPSPQPAAAAPPPPPGGP